MFNIYCDESCHLENDRQKSMVLGAIRVPKRLTKSISNDIVNIKKQHGINKFTEIKWTKVSNSKLDFFKSLIEYFFNNDNITFRALIVPDKEKLNHVAFKQTHDDWYYKMYYNMLKTIIITSAENYIYLDIKDTQGAYKVRKLQEVLCNKFRDFNQEIIRRIQQIRSEESQILQLADLLIGAVSYCNRELNTSNAKVELVRLIQERSGYSLRETTYYLEPKLNLLVWEPYSNLLS